MGLTNDSFQLVGKTHEDNNLLKSRQSGKANAEAQFFNISVEHKITELIIWRKLWWSAF
jgi:hypothetical protein